MFAKAQPLWLLALYVMRASLQRVTLVLIADMKHGKALAVGEVLMDSDTAKATKKGPVVKTLHYVSDKIWDYIKTLE